MERPHIIAAPCCDAHRRLCPAGPAHPQQFPISLRPRVPARLDDAGRLAETAEAFLD
ncbi:hypothetical protein ACFSL4_13085 [Streptomyces caeni]|uniref:Uncharacterized protein n=1 Tax=Streptomyces caeni TaxID=2307231 RepID=A0ABW4IP60_9ACTN